MRNSFLCLIVIASILVFSSCEPDGQLLELDDRYGQVTNIIATAENCTGPRGATFKTEIHTARDGYMFFRRDFDKGRPQISIVNPLISFQVDEDFKQLGPPLSTNNIDALRVHEFHKNVMIPGLFVKELVYDSKEKFHGKKLHKFVGRDQMYNTGFVYYDARRKVVAGFTFSDYMKPEEKIDLVFSNWEETSHGKLPFKVQMFLKGEEAFVYNFDKIEINSSSFEKKTRSE